MFTTSSLFCFLTILLLVGLIILIPLIEYSVAKSLHLIPLTRKQQIAILIVSIIICSHAIGLHNHSRMFSLFKETLGDELAFIIPIRILLVSLLYSILSFSSKLAKSSQIYAYPLKTNRQCFYITLGFTIMMFLLWFIEGTHVSHDYQGQITSARIGEYDKAHPVSHTIFCCLLLSIYDSIRSVIISQILFFSLSIYAITRFCKQKGISLYFTVAATFLATICTYHILLLAIKDSFFISSCTIAIVGLMSWTLSEKWKAAFLTTFGLIGVGIFRYDGQAIILLTAIALAVAAICYKRNLRQILLMIFIPCFTIICAHIVLPYYLNAKADMVGTKLAMPAEIVCEVIAQEGKITDAELRLAEKLIMPKEMIIKHHSMSAEYDGRKYMWDYFNNNEELVKYSFAYSLSGKEKELLPLALSIAIKNPFITIKHFVEQGRIVWDPSMQYREPCAFFFFINLTMIAILIRRKATLVHYIPFIPVITVAFTSMFIATTWEPRYTFPIFYGGLLSIAYTHCVLTSLRKQ